jgi:ATP-dependent helicase/nuclease subunit A
MPKWTREQEIAIERAGCDLLVSASAGTGKTTVLVERILRLIQRESNPSSLDRFLVVTFTEAAAAEMRERIAASLRRLREEAPEAERLRRQELLLENAFISTIHAFCAQALRRHFHVVKIDPEFVILDEKEAELLSVECADALLQRQFDPLETSADQAAPDGGDLEPRLRGAFLQWIDSHGGANPLPGARDTLLRLHRFLSSLEAPEAWLKMAREAYPIDAEGRGLVLPLERHAFHKDLLDRIRPLIDFLSDETPKLMKLAHQMEPRCLVALDPVAEMLSAVRASITMGDLTQTIRLIRECDPPHLGNVKSKDPVIKALLDQCRDLRQILQKHLQEKILDMSPETMSTLQAFAASRVHVILALAEGFRKAYDKAKKQRGCLDFNDLEQLALKLFRNEDGSPTEVAKEYQRQFEHVMVDEYQDVNHAQEAILRALSRGSNPDEPNNFFAVGDVKQSIYAFRLAAPGLFLKCRDGSTPVDNPIKSDHDDHNRRERVDLRENFRSRPGVIESVNLIFERVMTRAGADMDYDEGARLLAKADFPAHPDGSVDPLPTELHLIEVLKDGGNSEESANETSEADSADSSDADAANNASELDWENAEREAWLTGKRILEMTGRLGAEGSVSIFDKRATHPDGTQGAMRVASFRDIVVLMRSPRGSVDAYQKAFQELGIPCFADQGGLLSSAEVRDIMNLLRIIDNPLQDIPLAATLRSPLENWSPSDLARARLAGPGLRFYDALRVLCGDLESRVQSDTAETADSDAQTELIEKTREFIDRLDQWRTLARRKPLADLISTIYEETGYATYVLGDSGGNVARRNLYELLRISRRFDQFSRQGLARFLNFVDRFQEREGDYGAATLLGEGQDVVRIMSVHKSKGLEFPIVLLCGLGKKFNPLDASDPLLLSRERGIGLKIIDMDRGVKYSTPAHKLLSLSRGDENRKEELRILYVALTRARERLILVGSYKSTKKDNLDEWTAANADIRVNGAMSASTFHSQSSHLAWITRAVADCVDPKSAASKLFKLHFHTAEDTQQWARKRRLEKPAPAAMKSAGASISSVGTRNRLDALVDRIAWRYPHIALGNKSARVSTTELKRLWSEPVESEDRAEALAIDPEYYKRRGFAIDGTSEDVVIIGSKEPKRASAIERGVLTHLVLQHIDPWREHVDEAGISAQIDRMMDRGLLTNPQRNMVDIKSIAAFFACDVGSRLKAAAPDKVWREQAFLLGLRPSELGMDDLAEYEETERIRAQGIIDCLFEDREGRLILLDYKTDRVDAEQVAERALHHAIQLRIYNLAVEGVFGRRPDETWLYFLTPRVSRLVETETMNLSGI